MTAPAKNKGGRKKLGKKTVTLRLMPSTTMLLEKVPFGEWQFSSMSAYCERAILERLKKDGIQ